MRGIRRPSTWTRGDQGAFQGISFEDYLTAPGENKSLLMLLDEARGGCPAKYKRGLTEKTTPALNWGKAVHAWALESKREWVMSPYDNFRTAEAREWRDKQILPILAQSEEDEIIATATALRKHPLAWPLIKRGRREVSMWAWYDQSFLLKCRPDILQPTHIVDVKTAADASTHAFSRAMFKFGYDLQAAICWKAAHILGFEIKDYYLLAIERGDPPLFNVRRIAPETMEAAQVKLDSLLTVLEECRATDTWPDYTGAEIGEIDAPAWTMPNEVEIEGAIAL